MEAFLPYLAGLAVLLLIVTLFSLSFKLVWNALVGGIVLWCVDLVGAAFGFHIEITFVNALIVGFFGVPGVVALAFWKMFG
ncbi:MAG: pro-sigmaK processing inhibitor BofA [Acholeplasmataceae bacterium]|jgi:inhibitor of the pro-sigma K processing machinery|nr:pro-sigmaK processing inhibitor BofA family protein [Acidaminococcaceae bacterium]NLY83643.1 pro-sigmaK processing inhibitor BofA [Acholeplasmataceae bacterium]